MIGRLAASVVFLLIAGSTAYGHSWYSVQCCDNKDCRPIKRSMVEERADGYWLRWLDVVIPYSSGKIKDSKDGEFHWCECKICSLGTRCLYTPVGMM